MVSIEKDGRDKGYLLARMEAIITISHHKKEIKGERARHTRPDQWGLEENRPE